MATQAVKQVRKQAESESAPKAFRTLFHVIAIQGDKLRVAVPAWDRKLIFLKKSILPEPIQDALAIDYIFYAQVDLDASSPEDLVKSMSAFEPGGLLPKKELA
jgi:hypothetical protein